MEELVLEDRPGIVRRFIGWFGGGAEEPESEEVATHRHAPVREAPAKAAARYTVTVRRQVACKDDAVSAAMGFKRGEQQILNLTMTDPTTRQDIVEFLKGVSFALEGSWEELGEHIYLLVPATAYVEMAAATPRIALGLR